MIKLYSKDGKEVTVKTEADRKEYIASGFYSEKPFSASGSREEDKGAKDVKEDIEDAVFEEVSEEDELREEYFALFGKKAGNMKVDNIKAAIAEAAKAE